MFPFIQCFGKSVSSYGVCMVLGIILVVFLSARRGRVKGVCFENYLIISSFIIIFFLFGASLLYVFVTWSLPQIFSFIKNGDYAFLKNTGLVFYGGLISGVLGAFLGCKISKTSLFIAEESFIPYVPLGHAIGRVGCLMAGCCNGVEYNGIFAITYTNTLFPDLFNKSFFPVQILEALVNLIISFLLLYLCRRDRKLFDLLFAYVFLYGFSRFFIEFLRGDIIRGSFLKLSTSQWISAFLVAISLAFFCLNIVIKKKKIIN